MRKHNRRRHKLGRFVARVTEHEPLIARALFRGVLPIRRARVHALRDVGGLFGDDVLDVDLVGMKNVVVVHVTDLSNCIAHDFVDRQNSAERFVFGKIWNRDLAADDHDVALGVGFARDATMSILPDACVEDGVGNGVANFIGMTFPDRFGRKNVATGHKESDE